MSSIQKARKTIGISQFLDMRASGVATFRNLRITHDIEAETSSRSLAGIDLSDCHFRNVSLRGWLLEGAKISRSQFMHCDLSGNKFDDAQGEEAKFLDCELLNAFFRRANLKGAAFDSVDASRAILTKANLSGAAIVFSVLANADLQQANLTDCNLDCVNLTGADLSEASGLIDAATWLRDNFEYDPHEGLTVYRSALPMFYDAPDNWRFKPGAYLVETCNSDRTSACGSGVNFGTRHWVRERAGNRFWECLIEPLDIAGIVVPYVTYGKARCARLKLVQLVK